MPGTPGANSASLQVNVPLALVKAAERLAYFVTRRYIPRVSPSAPVPALRSSAPVNVGRVLGHAAVFNFSRYRTTQAFMDAANIPIEVEAFFCLLDERAVPYLLVGGVAMLAHVRGRNTEDIDLVLSLPDQDRLAPEVSIIERKGFFALGSFRESLRVDFLATENPLFALVAREYGEARSFEFLEGNRRVPCATPEGLALLKLYALPSLYRQYDFERTTAYESDLGKLLAAFPQMKIEALLSVLADHGVMPSDVEELRKVIIDVRPKIGRFGTGGHS
jgi:hypothetical protein